MISNQRKALLLPLKVIASIMIISLLIFYFGPIPWIDRIDFAVVKGTMLFIFYVLFFILGYYCRVPRLGERVYKIKEISKINEKVFKLLKYTIIINLVLTIANAFIYVGVSNISQLFIKMLNGLSSPDSVYYSKDVSSRSGNLIVWLTCFYSPIMYVTEVYAMFMFKKLKNSLKVCYLLTLAIEVMRWLAVGTNRGLFDIVLLLLYGVLINRVKFYGKNERKTVKEKRRQRKLVVIVFGVFILFFVFFSYALSSRINNSFHYQYFYHIPYKWLPNSMKFFVEQFDSYLTQGYSNTIKIIRNCKFEWTYGVGNSRFLLGILKKFAGVLLEEKTYPYQLAPYGIDPLASWHTAYSWFASDLTYYGIIPFMFIVGYFMCNLVREVLLENNPISLALLYLMFLSMVNISCTNYVLAYTNGFIGFWGLFIYRLIKKNNIKFKR